MNDVDPKNLEQEIARLQRLAYYDELTGIFNRRGFLEEAEHQFRLVSYGTTGVERRTGFQIPYAIILFDLDNFKSVNDTHGHAAGDAVLKAAANVLKTKLRGGDLFGRWGGEEFTVALIGADPERARIIAEKIRTALESAEIMHEGTRIPMTGSFGVAVYDSHGTLDELIAHADAAMYTAKKSGKNRVAVYAAE